MMIVKCSAASLMIACRTCQWRKPWVYEGPYYGPAYMGTWLKPLGDRPKRTQPITCQMGIMIQVEVTYEE